MGISIWQLLIILVIVLLLFGAKKIRNLGGDLGSAVKGFRDAVKEGEESPDGKPQQQDPAKLAGREGEVINAEATRHEDEKPKV